METIFMGGGDWQYTLYGYMRGALTPSSGVRLALTPLRLGSLLYRGMASTSSTWELRKRRRLPCPVVSIGNLTVGGTGKTPLTIWLARWLRQQGWRVAVLSRGYGGSRRDEPCVVSTGEGPLHTWSEVGDEPYLLAQELPGIPILVGKDRFASGQHARQHFGAQVVILDDGFQHYRLARDLDIVLIDATNPFGQGALLPRGILREPLRALQRADAVVLTRVELAQDAIGDVTEQIRGWAPHLPIYHLRTTVQAVWEEDMHVCRDAASLCSRRVVAFAGIGNPEAFAATLTQLGYDVAALVVFPDHHPYTERDGHAIIDVLRRYEADCLVTTTKDRVRLPPSWQASAPLFTIRIEVAFSEDGHPFQQQLQALMTYANDRE
ncbi:MAG: tetraacyldisaccharide 4'-kinase [Candidatus Tectomicrobia bacterium]|nr:tetraacyldisaccharide 4'-kinase [Candidatus Tectomicrobia bacterium]